VEHETKTGLILGWVFVGVFFGWLHNKRTGFLGMRPGVTTLKPGLNKQEHFIIRCILFQCTSFKFCNCTFYSTAPPACSLPTIYEYWRKCI